ncbi:MAG: SEL1-like repeat protein [Firmicutes bacterium]|nr:SEL1-like repeat protein [Bacillota bacterium]
MEHSELELKALYYKARECYRRPGPEAHDEGLMFLKEAAEGGSVEAMKLLGILQMSGQYAPYPEKNVESAVVWYRKAADAGDDEAMYWLSQCYEMGMGIGKSKREARRWRKAAIRAGFVPDDGIDDEDYPDEQNSQTAAQQTAPEPKNAIETAAENLKNKALDTVKAAQKKVEEADQNAIKKAEEAAASEPGPLIDSAVDIVSYLPKFSKDSKGSEESAKAPEGARGGRNQRPDPWTEKRPEMGSVVRSASETAEEAARKARLSKVKPPEETDLSHDAAEANRRDDEARHLFADSYQRKMLILGGLCGLIIALLIMCFIFFLLKDSIDTQQDFALLYAGGAILALALGALGAVVGIRRSAARSKQEDAYRSTPFYQCFHANLYNMDEQQTWAYHIYRSMEKLYYPVTNRQVPDLTRIRQFRGAMYPGWVFGVSSENRPEFVILTDRAVYVICTRHINGKLSGTYRDLDWILQDPDDERNIEKVENLLLKNELQVEAVKDELGKYSKVSLDLIPFFNIVFLNQEAELGELRITGADEKTMLVQGSYDKLRLSIGGKESTLHTHGVRLDALVDAFGKVGAEWLHRELSSWNE